MKKILRDWINFCADVQSFDKSHFMGLFKTNLSNEDLQLIFKNFMKSDELIYRTENVLNSGSLSNRIYLHPLSKNKLDADSLKEIAYKHILEQKKICEKVGDTELVDIINSVKVQYIDDKNQFESYLSDDIPHYWLYEVVGDYVRDSYKTEDKKIYALFEAFYGIASDYYLAWYIGSPLIHDFINMDYYFNLWKSGGKYALTDKYLYVTYAY